MLIARDCSLRLEAFATLQREECWSEYPYVEGSLLQGMHAQGYVQHLHHRSNVRPIDGI